MIIHKKYRYLILLVACMLYSEYAQAQLGGYSHRKKYSIESDQVSGSSDLTDFPLLFSLTDPDLRSTGNGGDVENINGYDIAFADDDGTTQLDHEIEYYDPTTGELIAWVRIPALSAANDTPFFIYYGDSGISTSQDTPDTWDNNYVLVMHMDGGATEDDATSFANDGTENGTGGIPLVTGQIGSARDFERSDADFIQVADDVSLDITGNVTMSFWFNLESSAPDFISKGINQAYEATSRNGIRTRFAKNGTNALTTGAANSLPNGSWVYLVYVQHSSGMSIYQDGTQVASNTNTTAFNTNNDPLYISRSGDAVDGIMDEVRISDVARSEEWIITEYNNQFDPSSFFTEIDDMPGLNDIESDDLLYIAGGSAVFLTSSLTIGSHPTVTTLDSVVVQITNNLDSPDDQLSFTNQLGITGTYNSTTGKLLLSGTTSLANYQTAIRAVQFSSTAGSPSQLTRTVSITGYDGTDATNSPERDINIAVTLTDLTSDIPNVVFQLDGQDLDGDGTPNNSETSPPADNSSVTSWGDLSSNGFDFTAGTAAIYDSLGFGERGSVEFDGANDELQKGGETLINNSAFNEKSFAFTFRTGSDVSGFQVIYEQATGGRGYNFSIVDGTLYAQAYSRGDGNWGSSNAERHKVLDLGTVVPYESYIVVASHDSNEWKAQVNNATTDLVTDAAQMPSENTNIGLGGNASNMRNPVTLANENGNLNGQIAEIASWNTALNSGQFASLYLYFDDKWGNTPPVLSGIEGTTIDFTETDSDTLISTAISVADSDPHNNLDSAQVYFSANYVSGEDSLIFADTPGITGSFDGATGVLTLSGNDTKANYQTALRSVRYRNSTINPTSSTRTVTFRVFDWDDESNTQSRDINVIDASFSPDLDNIEGSVLAYTEGDGAVSITSSITVEDPDDTDIESATITISSNYVLGEDELDFTDTGSITGSFNSASGILTLTGTDTKANYESALRSVTFENTSLDPVTLNRVVDFVVNDGDNNSNTVSRTISVTAQNSPPVLSSIEGTTLTYPNAAVNITNTIQVTDPDDTSIDSALVLITNGFDATQDSLLYSPIFGISGSYDETTGRLLLQGNSSFSDYQTALRSVEYKNYGAIPSGGEREISFLAYDDEQAESDTVKRTIEVSAVEAISGLEVWLRADVGVDTTAGGEVTTWNDQSGNNNHFTGVADAGIRPTFSLSNTSLSGGSAVRFAGDGDHLEDADGHTNYINGMTEFTLFLVYKSDLTGTDRGLWIADDPSGADEIFTIRYDASGANNGGAFTNVVKTGILGNTPANQLESFSDIQTTDAQITSLHWESNTAYDIYVDGILNNPSSAGPPPTGTISNATTAILGKGGKDDPNAANVSWDGLIAEMILYNRNLTQAERESIEDYLSLKYGSAIREITAATGGEAISADDANGSFTSLTGPVIQEGFSGELVSPGTIIFNAPAGYKWNTGTTPSVTAAPAYGGTTTLTASFDSFSADSTTVTFTIDSESTSNPGQLTFSGLQVRPDKGTLPNTGNITNTGTTGQGGGTNYGTLTMVPGAPDSLVFVRQPSITNIDSTVTPSVRVQVVDQFSNNVETSGTNVNILLASGTGTLSGTGTVSTNALGIADFSDLSIDMVGSKTLAASATGLGPDTSSVFEIVNAGTLTGFTVERAPSGIISSKAAGQSFNIKITAVDGTGNPVTTFNGTVVVSSSCTMGTGQGTTSGFSSGVLSSLTVSITSTGTCEITATNSSGPETGTSNTFTVSAGAASGATSTITSSPTVILNDGASTSTITVDLKDQYGNNISTGGDVVALSITPTALGSLGSVTDNSDGTYSAVLTSSTTAGTDNITGTVNGNAITDDTDVEYAAFTHIWESQLGSVSDASNWEDAANWNAGTVPGASSVVLIPASPAVGNEQPVVDVAGASVTSVSMESGASLTISGGINFTITSDLSGGSILGSNADSLTVGGDVLNVTDITVGQVILNGSSDQAITNPHSYTNLEIDNASVVSIEQDLTVSDSLKLTSGELLIPSGKNLLAEGISYGTGVLRFQREITGVRGWRIISSPVSSTYGDFLDETVTQGYSGATYSTGSNPGDTLQPNVLTYLESFPGTDNQRYRAPTSASQTLTAGQGVFVFFFGDITADPLYNDPLPDTLDVSGQEFSGPGGEIDFGVTYTTAADSGWNLVGNPLGGTIDWDDNANWTKTNIESTIYIWDPAANGGNGEYLTWNGVTGTLGSGLIPPFQGFWVKANGASPVLRVSKDVKTTGGAFLRKQAGGTDLPLITLELSSNGLSKQTSLMFSPDGEPGKDPLDAFELLSLTNSRIELSTVLPDGTLMAINHQPAELTNRIRIPLSLGGYLEGTPISDTFRLRAINMDNIPDEWMILLTDRETGQEYDLRSQEPVEFFYDTQSSAKVAHPLKTRSIVQSQESRARYILKITTEEIEANIPEVVFLNQNYPNPFNPTSIIEFGISEESMVELEVFDILGRKVRTLINANRPAGTYQVTMDALNLASGVYIYRLRTQEGTLLRRFTIIK